ncbi:TIGR03943 family putative permease subunit [Actinoalloteichus hymeniacidonis]|uniref:TIGR03943 family protein n=1 Tax=Actinoalloteichus hymeniacidonis TaxID=340345 RepID=A0AAC9HUA5_9PSEU|nr:TIGR03943 family protein [Actinoalloteichus hymeniacidonis]AOS65046.1 putative TIGR03943 family protein [Actinoalloteichus hymeniacidonis]MBB5906875.1 putative repeat protein (TIGR03943 family) [Actinoalloteichus hymeniacidonis]
MRRETQNVLLVLLGGALVKISWDGTYLRYVRPSLLPLLLGAGLVIVAIGVIAIVFDIWGHRSEPAQTTGSNDVDGEPDRRARAASAEVVTQDASTGALVADSATGVSAASSGASASTRPEPTASGGAATSGEHAEEHAHRGRSSWMLMLPVLAILMIAPPALGSDSVQRAGDRSVVSERPPSSGLFGPLPEGEIPEMQITDVVMRTVWDAGGALEGRRISVTGFLVREEASGDSGAAVHVARIRIMCCAADALPVKLRLTSDGAPAAALDTIAVDGWMQVVGEVVPGSATEANGNVPEFLVSEVTPIEAPADQYEY